MNPFFFFSGTIFFFCSYFCYIAEFNLATKAAELFNFWVFLRGDVYLIVSMI